MKVAFDENVPIALVRVFKTFAGEKQLRFLTKGLTIESAADYTPRPGDPDYERKNDAPWIKRFAAAGGRVIISGDVDMKSVPHERLALVEAGMVVIFFERQWSNWPFFRKCALLLHWWPVIAAKVIRAKKGSFWRIPCSFALEGKLVRLSTKDEKKLKLERQLAAKGKPRKPTPAKSKIPEALPYIAKRPRKPKPVDARQAALPFDEPSHETAENQTIEKDPQAGPKG